MSDDNFKSTIQKRCENYHIDFEKKYFFDTYTTSTNLLSNRNLNKSPSMTPQDVGFAVNLIGQQDIQSHIVLTHRVFLK